MTTATDIVLDAKDGGFLTMIDPDSVTQPFSATELNNAVVDAGLDLGERDKIKPSRPETFVTMTCDAIASRIKGKGGLAFAKLLRDGKGKGSIQEAWRAVYVGKKTPDGADADWTQVLRGRLAPAGKVTGQQAQLVQFYKIPVKDGRVPYFTSPLASARGDELVDAAYQEFVKHQGMVAPPQVRDWMVKLLTSGTVEGATPAMKMSQGTLYIPESLRPAYEVLADVVGRKVGYDFLDTRGMIRRSLVDEANTLSREIQSACIRPDRSKDPAGWEAWSPPGKKSINAMTRKIRAKLDKLKRYAKEQDMDLKAALETVEEAETTIDIVSIAT